ncbi:MAG TPA: hypothetical protein VNM92_11750 [Thermoanaerobaculia bacterium]|nr:hypothetical protein [Thermoanaerobaculia bacterium]
MWKRTLLAAAWLASASAYGQIASTPILPFDATESMAVVSPLADGCVETRALCNTDIRGRLDVGDCATSSGGLSDVVSFDGVAGQLVTVIFRALSTTLTNPYLTLEAPAGDGVIPPVVTGSRGGTIRYTLSSTGRWKVLAGSRDRFASGDYLISLSCVAPSATPTEPQSCVLQGLQCGQTSEWALSQQSCRFPSPPQDPYAGYEIYAVQGDVLAIEMSSSTFQPLFALYGPRNELILSSRVLREGTDGAVFTVPFSGYYRIAATTKESLTGGAFSLRVDCAISGCLAPKILSQPQDIAVSPGQRATLSVELHQIGRVTADWFRLDDSNVPVLAGSGTTFMTPPVTGGVSYFVSVRNECGQETSRVVRVLPRIDRRRAARR